MEKFNFPGGKNVIKSVCWILSYLSWLLASVNNLAAINWMYNPKKGKQFCFIWNIFINPAYKMNPGDLNVDSLRRLNSQIEQNVRVLDSNGEPGPYYIPLQMSELMIYIVFNFVFAMVFIGCVVYIIKTFIKREIHAIDGLFEKFSQFHFFPLLCAFAMSLLGELNDGDEKKMKSIACAGLAISVVGLASLLFIYIIIKSDKFDSQGKFFIKYGAFSCLIILFWYNFCYDIFQVRMLTKNKDEHKWAKGCSLAFSIIFGVGSLSFSFIFKDIMVSFVNILIYIGLSKYYFELGENMGLDTRGKDYNKNGDGAVDIVILVCSIVLFFFLIYDNIMTKIDEIKSQMFNLGQVQTQTIVKVNANSDNINLLSSNMNIPANPIESSERKL